MKGCCMLVEGRPLPVHSQRPVKKTVLKHKGRTMSTAPKPVEADQKRINHITKLFLGMDAFKPAGIPQDRMETNLSKTRSQEN